MSPGRTTQLAGHIRLDHPHSSLRRLAVADESFCRTLFREQRAVQFAPLSLSSGALDAILDQQFEAQRIVTASRFPDAEAFVIIHAGFDVGRLIVTLAHGSPASEGNVSSLSDDQTLHLVDLVITASARNSGIGTDVITSLARAGHALGAKSFTLSVLQSNEAACRLYRRLGFLTISDGVYSMMARQIV